MPDNPQRGSRPTVVRAWRGGRGQDGSASARGTSSPPPAHARRLFLLASLLLLLLGLVVARTAATRYTDLLWYREIGYERVFLLKIVAQWALGLLTGAATFALLYVNGRIALRPSGVDPLPTIGHLRADDANGAAVLTRLVGIALLPASLITAILAAIAAATQWRVVVQFLYRSPFGSADPVFGRDIAYYVFTLPLVDTLLGFARTALTLSLAVIVAPIYLARGEIHRYLWRFRTTPFAAMHLGLLSAMVLAVVALRMWFVDVPGVLYETHTPLQGASYTDLHVRVLMIRIVAIVALLAAGIVLGNAWRGRFGGRTAAAFGTLVGAMFLLLGIVPALFQRLIVQPNELARETPQIRNHIAATRHAWGLDSVVRRELGTEQGLSMRDIAANHATVSNVRLWDREPLLQTYGQLQAIRTYYDFVAVDDDRYRIGTELRQVMLSARELNSSALPTRTFINEHLTFTHGMGLTLGPSNQVTGEGLPLLWVKDLPPATSVPIRITRPQIYFGELANDFVLAPTRQREFDYPAGEGDAAVYSQFDGSAGVPAGSLARRLLFALRFRSLNVVLSRDLLPTTRVLFHRNIRERAELALPFLRFDQDPYLVVTDSGRLVWMLDGYTTTDRYPYSQRIADGTNYMRNSVKATVDAYDGRVRAYLVDPTDPMIRTLSRIYPGLLRPLAEMPADLRAHMRYPQDLFSVQSALYATFHMTDAETFYHREDQWQVPRASRGGRDDESEQFMRHIVMRLPGEREPEFILMRPFTPRQKDNLAAWMVARNDGEHYGKLVAYRFPKQSLVFGPAQIVNRINQDIEVARQVSLWDQRGSEVIRGELLVIPIEGSLIYVQPLYLRAQGGRIPELKRVIVVHENQVVMEGTLEAGLNRLFGGTLASGDAAIPSADSLALGDTTEVARGAVAGASTSASAGGTAAQAELVRRAVQHYERARAAQRADDWATYGVEMKRLGETLTQLNAAGTGARAPRNR